MPKPQHLALSMDYEAKKAQRNAALGLIEQLKPADKAIWRAIVEHVGPVKEWPLQQLRNMLGNHLVYHKRMDTTFFVLLNGLAPDLYVEWLLKRRMLRDNSARLHVASIIAQHQDGKLQKFTSYLLPFRATVDKPLAERKHAWDGVGDPVCDFSKGWPSPAAFIFPVTTPSYAHNSDDSYHWEQAINALKHNDVNAPAVPRSVGFMPERKVEIVPYMEGV